MIQRLLERNIRRRDVHVVTTPEHAEPAGVPRLSHDFAREPSLADARLAGEEHNLAASRSR
jgi:hypothetical protein